MTENLQPIKPKICASRPLTEKGFPIPGLPHQMVRSLRLRKSSVLFAALSSVPTTIPET